MSINKINHLLEIHSEFRGLTKILMINLNFINSIYVKKIIFISNALRKKFNFVKKRKTVILHDAVDIKNFLPFKNINSHFVMTAHILYKKIDPKFVATQSNVIIKNIIRKKLKFNGLIILALITFLALIYLNSFRESIEDFVKSEENINNVKTYTH